MTKLMQFEDGLCIATPGLTPTISKHYSLTVKNMEVINFSKLLAEYFAFLKPKICGDKIQYRVVKTSLDTESRNHYIEASGIIASRAKQILAKYVKFV